jgi:hypothetical protein
LRQDGLACKAASAWNRSRPAATIHIPGDF